MYQLIKLLKQASHKVQLLLFLYYINYLPLTVNGSGIDLYANYSLYDSGKHVQEVQTRLHYDVD